MIQCLQLVPLLIRQGLLQSKFKNPPSLPTLPDLLSIKRKRLGSMGKKRKQEIEQSIFLKLPRYIAGTKKKKKRWGGEEREEDKVDTSNC